MRRSPGALLIIALALACGLLRCPPVRACSCDVPDLGFLGGPSIEIPRNARGILWAGTLRALGGLVVIPPEENFRVEARRGNQWLPVPIQVTLVRDPRGPSDSLYDVLLVGARDGMAPGEQFRFVYLARQGQTLRPATCPSGLDSQVVLVNVSEDEFVHRSREVRVTKVQAGSLQIAVGVSCARSVRAEWIDVDDVLPAELIKWQDALYFSTTTRRRLWHPRANLCESLPPGRSWVGIGRERIYHLTEAVRGQILESGVEADSRTAIIDVWLPGTGEAFTTTVLFSFLDQTN